MTRRILYTLRTEAPNKHDVRYLLLHSLDGAKRTVLTEMANGTETEMATGTEFEMGKKAEEIVRHLMAAGFRVVNDNQRAFDSLKNTVAVAMACGYTGIYDNRFKKEMNFTGLVPLSRWPGLTGKNGGSYEYAFDGMKIVANPALPPHHGLNMTPQTNEEAFEVMGKMIKLKQAVGPEIEFILNDQARR